MRKKEKKCDIHPVRIAFHRIETQKKEITVYLKNMVFKDTIFQYASVGEARILEKGKSIDYEYFLTDHQSNVRATVTGSTQTYQATMESEYATDEEYYFGNISETRKVDELANATTGGNEVSALNSTKPIGPSIIFKVGQGDTVKLSTKVYYVSHNYGDANVAASDILNGLMNSINPTTSTLGESLINDLNQSLSGMNNLLNAAGPQSDDYIPNGYINYIFLDENMNVTDTVGFRDIESAGILPNDNSTPLEMEFTVANDGYILAYISNESASTEWVSFDDFTVTHIKKREVKQINHYYPFGLK